MFAWELFIGGFLFFSRLRIAEFVINFASVDAHVIQWV